MIREILHKEQNKRHAGRYEKLLIALDLAILILGIGCIVDPDLHYQGFPYILGILMLCWGGILIDHSLRTREYMNRRTHQMAVGIILVVLAVLIMAGGEDSDGLIGASWGMFGLVEAADSLNTAIYRITTKQKNWIFPFLHFLIGGTLAVLLLWDPAEKMYGHMIFVGMEFLYMGLENGIHRILHVLRERNTAA